MHILIFYTFHHFNSQPHEEADAYCLAFSSSPESFQLTASQRGWPDPENSRVSSVPFQLTASRRGWLLRMMENPSRKSFQLTASRRGWPMVNGNAYLSVAFQLTASRRGWQPDSLRLLTIHYFNSQPHEEADGDPWHANDHSGISTHSLTKRLTSLVLFYTSCKSFQLTASRRGWPIRAISFSIFNYFNSQPHEEADQIIFRCLYVYIISTHSLTKRLTVSARIFVSVSENFNSQPHEEADHLN